MIRIAIVLLVVVSSSLLAGYTLYDRNRQGLDWKRGDAYGPEGTEQQEQTPSSCIGPECVEQ